MSRLILVLLVLAGDPVGCTRGPAIRDGTGESHTPASGGEAAAGPDSVVRLDAAAERLVGLEVHAVGTADSSALVTNGTITYDANRVSVVGPRVEGRIVSVRTDLGEPVRTGAVLAVIESPDVGQLRGDLARARAALDVARQNYEREERLFGDQITSQKALLEAQGGYRSAEADVNSARARLDAVGAASGQGAAFGLLSPLSGTVVERNASPGQLVGPSSSLFTVADLHHVWISADVFESDLPRVRQGAPATVLPQALPGEAFQGRVTYAGGVVDSATRTFKVRVEVPNPTRRLRPGMFAQVRISTLAAPGAAPPVVPDIAVQELDRRQVVFVPGRRAGEFIARPVVLGPPAGDGMVTVTGGLKSGDRIVTKGAFQLKAELTKASFGEAE